MTTRVLRPVAVLLVLAASRASAQVLPEAGTWRIYQGSAELGRESFRRSGDTLVQAITVPVVNLQVLARTTWRAAALTGFQMTVRNAAGDSVRGTYAMERAGDSLRVTQEGGGQRRDRAVPAGAAAVVAPQSIGLFAELIRGAAGRDTTLPLLVAGADTVLPATLTHGGDSVRVAFAGLQIIGRLADGRLREVAVPQQHARAVLAAAGDSLPPLRGLRRPVPDYAAPADAPWTAEEVRVPVGTAPDSFTLACTLTRPKGVRGRLPAAVTITGSGSQTRDEELWPLLQGYRLFGEVAEGLGRAGIAVLRCDDRGAGGSGGHAESATTADLAGDTRAQVRWLRAEAGIDPARIALIGHSEGGMIGPMVAAEDARIAAVVIMAGPAKNGVEVLVDQVQWPIRTAAGLTPEARDSQLAEAARAVRASAPSIPWLQWFRTYEPLPTIRRLRQPVLILQGALDRQVSAGQADTLAATLRAAGNRRVALEVYPRLNHLFLPSSSDGSPAEYPSLTDTRIPAAVLDRLTGWLASVLRAVPAHP